MAKETDTTRLEARIVELENALKALAALRQPVDLSADEIKAYLKVRDAIACDPNCGNWACDPNCGNWPCAANCGNYPCGVCVANCGNRTAVGGRCGAFTRGGYFGSGLTRFGELGS